MKQAIKNFLLKHENLEFFIKLCIFKVYSWLTIFLNDEIFLKIQYRLRTGKSLALKNPKLYNEKIQWLKLYYKDSLLNLCVDKWEVRKYVSEKGLSEILIPAVGVFNNSEEIVSEDLPKRFILKLTNGSSFNIICTDKLKFDITSAQRKFRAWTKIDFFSARREWAYKNVKNRILCEHLILNDFGNPPSDYRFFCFKGEPKIIAVDLDSIEDGKKTSNYYRHLFTPKWEPIMATINYPNKPNFTPPKPKQLDKLLDIARKLSKDFPAVRVDLYYNNENIYFGELTFYHASGYQKIEPVEFEHQMGSWIDLHAIQKPGK